MIDPNMSLDPELPVPIEETVASESNSNNSFIK